MADNPNDKGYITVILKQEENEHYLCEVGFTRNPGEKPFYVDYENGIISIKFSDREEIIGTYEPASGPYEANVYDYPSHRRIGRVGNELILFCRKEEDYKAGRYTPEEECLAYYGNGGIKGTDLLTCWGTIHGSDAGGAAAFVALFYNYKFNSVFRDYFTMEDSAFKTKYASYLNPLGLFSQDDADAQSNARILKEEIRGVSNYNNANQNTDTAAPQKPTGSYEATEVHDSYGSKKKESAKILPIVAVLLICLAGFMAVYITSGGLDGFNRNSDYVTVDEKPIDAKEELVDVDSNETESEQQTTVYDKFIDFVEHCDTRYYDRADLEGFDAGMAVLARNAPYAHAGRKFNTDTIRSFFEQFSWYHPLIEADAFKETMLNDYETANKNLVVAFEKEKGYK